MAAKKSKKNYSKKSTVGKTKKTQKKVSKNSTKTIKKDIKVSTTNRKTPEVNKKVSASKKTKAPITKNPQLKSKSKQKTKLTTKQKIIKSLKKLIETTNIKFKKMIQNIQKNIIEKNKKYFKKRIVVREEKARRKEEIISKNSDVRSNKSDAVNLKIVLSLLTILIITVVLIILFKNDTKEKIELEKINISQYLELYDNKDVSYIYIKSKNCAYCGLIEPYIDRLQKDYKLTVKELDYDKLNKKEIEQLENSNSVFSEGWKLPILISIKDGKELSNIKGYKEYSVFKKFVEYSMNPEENNSFIKITIDKYLSILNSDELSVVYIGRKKSNGCEVYTPILEKVSKEKNIKIYYLDTDILDTESDWNKLKSSSDIFKGSWFMPATLIVKSGNVIDYKFESMDKETLTYFFNRNEV